MEFTLSMGILVFATAIILLCSFAIIVTSAAADIDSGLHRAKDNVCANDPLAKVVNRSVNLSIVVA
jgi:hypothetical protein